MPDESHFIDGIFNYCDRWCERCPLTARCRLFAEEQEDPPGPGEQDMRNAAFWEKLGRIFEQALQQLREFAAERGIDLSKAEPPGRAAASRRRKSVLARRALRYARWVERWFRARRRLFRDRGRKLGRQAVLDLPGADPERAADDLRNAVAVIRWYRLQIYVKLQRAWSGWTDPALADETCRPFPRDADGSAKVALIGLDRSLAAWSRLREHFPEKGDEILNVLVYLERLRRGVEAAFPEARAFRRPGFDDAG
jgi:hypothetical protein